MNDLERPASPRACPQVVPAPPVRLLLEDGTELQGRAFGVTKAVCGEVVFNTADPALRQNYATAFEAD